MEYFVYILECSNGSFYVGYTTDVERRFQEHLEGTAKCKYTRSFPPKRLVAYWSFGADKSLALRVEHALKSLDRKAKKVLSLNPKKLDEYISF